MSRLTKNSDLTELEVEKLIKQMKKKIGAGYLTDQGALFLIASDLGISLTESKKTKRNSLQNIEIKEITKDDLNKKAKAFNSDRLKDERINKIGSIFLIGGIFALLAVLANYETPNDPKFVWGSIVLVIGIIGFIISLKISTRPLEKKEIIFLKFYNTFQKINEYKYRDSKQDTKKYRTNIIELASFIGGWTRNSAPTDLSELPYSISSNLKKNIVSIIKENNSKEIEILIKLLEKMMMFTYDQEPTAQLLRAFNEDISEFEYLEDKKIKEEKTTNNLLLKLIWIPPLAGIIFYFILLEANPTDIQSALGYSVPLSVVILIALVTLVRRK